jgi:hypothetical protein
MIGSSSCGIGGDASCPSYKSWAKPKPTRSLYCGPGIDRLCHQRAGYVLGMAKYRILLYCTVLYERQYIRYLV